MKRLGVLSIALATAVTLACNSRPSGDTVAGNGADRQAVGTAGIAGSNDISAADRTFIQDMMNDGDAEVQLGKLASERAASADVKRVARMMVEDHTKAGGELKQIAATYNIPAEPAKADDAHHDLMDKLAKLNGAAFDREYMNAMVDGHQDVVDRLESHVDSNAGLKDRVTGAPAKDTNVSPEKADSHVEASINQWSAATLPVVRHHLDEAKTIQDSLKDTRRNTTSRNR
jgi:putative membrane protein